MMHQVSIAGDTTIVVFEWSNEHGHCYECGLPAAFLLPNAYGQPVRRDVTKRCAVCAANAAANGETVRRIEP